MTSSTIFHVHFVTGKDAYFGSIAAIYDTFDRSDIGVTKQRLYDYRITPDRPYSNKLCTISKSDLKRKKGKRKVPKPKVIKSIAVKPEATSGNLSSISKVNF